MSRKFNKENTELIIDYSLEGEAWEKAYDKAKKELAKTVTVPGFRKGKAPLFEALKKIDPVRIFDKAINDNLEHVYKEHIITQIEDNDKIVDNYRPAFNIKEIDLKKAVYEFIFPLYPEIKLGDYKKIETKLADSEVTEEEIITAKNKILENYVVMIDSEEPIKLNDRVNFDFVGFIDGEKFDGGEAEKFDLVIGSNQFIPGFESQMIGLKKGETKDLNLKFPETYHAKDLAGKDVVFRVTINSIKTANYPEVNDQFLSEVKVNPLVTNLESFNEFVLISALKEKLHKNSSEFVESAINEIISKSSVTLSEILINEEAERYYKSFMQQLKQKGISERDYIEFAKTTKEDILKLYKEEAKKNLTKSFVFGKIVDDEKLHVSAEDYEAKINQLANLYGLKPEQIKTFMPFKQFEQGELPNKIFEKLAELNDAKSFAEYKKENEKVLAYNKKAEEAIVAVAKAKSQEKSEEK
ncbi:trigger factor [Mycoplasmopsis arginini]|uniref:trigger factor n=1 Tax=Mycoplasmopsis arginini TaxID=2094 RepID=UPI00227BF008|nr:trigger factor [Mycoplasmopsis arginini]MCY2902993.1 trigger factor [Mycoplasmopsis arginini QMP CG1-2758]MDI3350411.1 trigger factor [Mycoplasmopsis arginini]MDI3351007.1 trigger factor [Mycoplasmopsis arginini]MDI3352688.1 trigger factor [Mycoplasmopsis arginini]